jgi:hypothetical protein
MISAKSKTPKTVFLSLFDGLKNKKWGKFETYFFDCSNAYRHWDSHDFSDLKENKYFFCTKISYFNE